MVVFAKFCVGTKWMNSYDGKYTEIRFKPDDDLPLNKTLELHSTAIVVKYVFHEVNKYYPEIFFDECLYKWARQDINVRIC